MKKRRIGNGAKPVTVLQIEQLFAYFEKKHDKRFQQIERRFQQIERRFQQIDKHFQQIDKRFQQIDKRFKQIDSKFDVVNGKIAAYFSVTMLSIDKTVQASEERLRKEILDLKTIMDAFIKRSEANEREIMFLGKQHDDLAKYCTEKIGYPVYGRI